MLPLTLCGAIAATAPYATVDELGGAGVPHQLALSTFLEVQHFPSDAQPNGLRTLGSFGARERTLFGRSLAYAMGLDASVGGSNTGAAYGASIYPIGLGVRFGAGGELALVGGIGADRVVHSVPLAARIPAELSLVFELGFVRPTVFVRPSWIAGAEERRHGSRTWSTLDELEAGVTMRFGAQHRYWSTMNAGRGPSIGVVYRELMGARAIGVTLGLDLAGGQ